MGTGRIRAATRCSARRATPLTRLRPGAILRRIAASLREERRGTRRQRDHLNGQPASRRCGSGGGHRGGNGPGPVSRDDAHLRSLGIKPELKRSARLPVELRGRVQLHQRLDRDVHATRPSAFGVGGPAFFWAWPLVILGQTFVALNFAELASHFPVAGSIYQWSKRLSNRTLGWFTGWIYFWAGVITVTAVAVTVPLVAVDDLWAIKLSDPSIPLGPRQPVVHRRSSRSSSRPLINVAGVRLLSIINNIGVAAEILGMLVFALILLFFANHQPPSVLFDTSVHEKPRRTATTCRSSLVGVFMALFVVYGFDTAGTFGEETIDASRQAPRGVLSAIWLSGIVGAIFLLAVILSFKDIGAAITARQAFGFPIADDDQGQPDLRHRRDFTFGDALPVRDPRRRSTSAPWPSRARPSG